MAEASFDIEALVAEIQAVVKEPPTNEPVNPATTMRERFFEMLVMVLANLYAKTPVASSLLDRVTLQRVSAGMEDGDAGKLSMRGEDWMRVEGLLKQQEGQKAYFVARPTLAVLSTITSAGTIGEVIDKLLKRYNEAPPTANIRRVTRLTGSYILARLSR